MAVLQVLLLSLAISSSSCLNLPPVLDLTRLEPEEPKCKADMTVFKEAIVNNQMWAEKMWDAGVKAPVGLLSQTAVQFGDFDECLSSTTPIVPKYCLMDVNPTETNSTSWTQFKWAICIPASCSSQDLQTSIQKYMDNNGKTVKVAVIQETCTTKEQVSSSFSLADITFCFLLIAIFLVVGLATIRNIRDGSELAETSPPETMSQCLSACYGYHSLLYSDRPIPGIDLNVFYGFHTTAIFFVIMGHRFGVHMFFMTITNYSDVEHMYVDSWFSIWSSHLDLFVDVFFFMSSFLLSVMYYGELHKRFINPLLVYIHRFCRLVPVYIVVLFFYNTLLRHLGSGPLWNLLMESEHESCSLYWWTNLLFINTYVNPSRLCMPHTWFLSADFQLFVCGTLLVLLLQKKPRIGIVITAVTFIASSIAPFWTTYVNNLPAIMLFNKDFWTNARNHEVFTTVYTLAYYRGTSYLVGLLAGCYVYRRRNKPLNKSQTYMVQAVGIAICLAVYWSGYPFYDPAKRPSRLVSALYAASFHTVFGIGMSFFVTSCTIGHSTFVSKVFSWRGFVPLSKLSYCVYLLHLTPQLIWLGSLRSPATLSPLELVSWTIADMTLCLVAALVLNLTVETPSRYLLKHFLSGYLPVPMQSKKAETKETCSVQLPKIHPSDS